MHDGYARLGVGIHTFLYLRAPFETTLETNNIGIDKPRGAAQERPLKLELAVGTRRKPAGTRNRAKYEVRARGIKSHSLRTMLVCMSISDTKSCSHGSPVSSS